MALTDGDKHFLKEMRNEDRAHLDAVTEKIEQDSVRQWKVINEIKTDLQVHKAESAGVHQQPCQTAQVLLNDHVEKKHNVAKTLGALAAVATIVAALGGLAFKIIHG